MNTIHHTVYDYLATHRDEFFTVRQVRDALSLTDSQARGALYALWRAQQITSRATSGPVSMTFGIEEVSHAAVRRDVEAR